MAADADSKERIEREAADWLVKLGDPRLDEVERRAFRHWLETDAAHMSAFDDVRRLWDGLAAPAAGLARLERRRSGRRRATMAVAAAVAAVAFLGVGWLGEGADYVTAHGAPETLTLADGSRVMLDGDTALDVEMDEGARRVVLLRGRAFFDVTADPHRPFVVTAGGVEARALGTAYAVDRRKAGVEVVVAHGRVAVEARQGDAAEVGAGERVVATGGGVPEPEAAALAEDLAWRRGLIVLRDQRLADVAFEWDRATGARMVIPQAAVRDLRLSGVFRSDDPDAVLDALESGLGLTAIRLGLVTVILR